MPPKPLKVDPGEALFVKAEKMFQSKSYDQALELYQRFYSQFPDRPQADGVLMRIAKIYELKNKYSKARITYQRLIDDYPQSRFVPSARLKMLGILYNGGKYREVIRHSAKLLERSVSRDHLFQIYMLLGDSYTAIQRPEDAVNAYALAYQRSKNEEKATVIQKLKGAIKRLDTEKMMFLLKHLDDQLLTGDFLYQLGLSYVDEQKIEAAMAVLSFFIQKFPNHEKTQPAKSLIKDLEEKSIYHRHTIGCLVPLSGPYKIYGNKVLKGVELALTEFISQHSGLSIKIIIKDTESDPNKAAHAVQELFKERVAAVIGPIAGAQPAANEAQKLGLPMITLTQKMNITDTGDYVFRNFMTTKMQVKTLASYAMKTLRLKRFAILYPDENYGKRFMNLFWDEIIPLGGKVVGVESYNINHTDFADPIKKLVGLYYDVPENLKLKDQPVADEEENPPGSRERKAIVDFDAIFIPDAPNKAGLIIPQLAYYDIKDVYLLGTNLWHSEKLIKMARQYVQGAVMTDGFFADSKLKRVRRFVDSFKKIYGEKPGYMEAVAYDTARILFAMVSRPDIRFRSSLKDGLKNLRNFEGVSGMTSFDDHGEAWKKLYLLQIKGDKFIEITDE